MVPSSDAVNTIEESWVLLEPNLKKTNKHSLSLCSNKK